MSLSISSSFNAPKSITTTSTITTFNPVTSQANTLMPFSFHPVSSFSLDSYCLHLLVRILLAWIEHFHYFLVTLTAQELNGFHSYSIWNSLTSLGLQFLETPLRNLQSILFYIHLLIGYLNPVPPES